MPDRQADVLGVHSSVQMNQLLIQRLRIGLWLTLITLFLFGAVDLFLQAGRPALRILLSAKIFGMAVDLAMFAALRTRQAQRNAAPLALAGITIGCVATTIAAIASGDDQATPLVFTVMVMGTATLFPWSVWAQFYAVAIALVAYLANIVGVSGSVAALISYPTAGVVLAMLTSIAVTSQLDRFRLDLAERERERSRSDAALRASESNLRGIFDHLDDIFFRTDLRGNLLMVSPSVRRYGYEVDELVGTALIGLVLSEGERQRLIDAMLADNRVSDFEVTLTSKSGAHIPMSITARLLVDDDRRAIGTEGMLRDISVRKRAEAVLRSSEERFRALAQEAPVGIFTTDAQGNCTFVNERWCEISGLTPEAAYGVGWAMALHPDDREIIASLWQAAIQGNGHFAATYRFRAADGTVTWVNGSATQLRNDAGEVTEYIGTIADITEHKNSEERLAALLDLAKDVSGTLNLTELLDRAHQRILGILHCDAVATWYWDPEEGVSRLLSQRGMPPAAAEAASLLRFARGTGFRGQLTAGNTIVANRSSEYAHFQSAPILDHWGVVSLVAVPMVVRGETQGTLLALSRQPDTFPATQVQLVESIARQLAIAIEATELHAAQQQEARIAGALARVGQSMIASLTTKNVLDQLCEVTTGIMGCDLSFTFLKQADGDSFVPAAHSGDSAEEWEALRAVEIPASMIRPLIDQLESAGPVQVGVGLNRELLPPILQAIYGIAVSMFIPLRRGSALIGFHTAAFRKQTDSFQREQVRIAAGLAQLASLAIENARLVGELENASRIKSDFVATMSHELRTPLAVVIGYSDLLLDGEFGELTSEQADTIRRMEKHAQGLLELVRTILDLSRLESDRVSLHCEMVDLRELLDEITRENQAGVTRPELDVRWHVDPDFPPLFTDHTKLKVVLGNIIGNAIKFTESGSVEVRARLVGEEVEIRVTDTGIGIPQDALSTIFEPFQQGTGSINARYGGAGLGLHIVRRLLDLLNGRVTVESEVGRGSIFHIHLPIDTRQESFKASNRPSLSSQQTLN